MKKGGLFKFALLSVLTFGLIASCGPTSQPEVITGVEIGGQNTVYIGKTIKLIADVLGSDDDSVTWFSENESIATINSTGTLTGISEGEVKITAKSTAEPQYFAEKIITVTAERATGLTILIEENESITKVNTSIYNVTLGTTVDINLSLNPTDSKKLDSVAVEVTGPSDIPSSQFVVKQNENDIMHATFTGFVPAQGVTVKFTGSYIGNTTSPLISSVIFNVIDAQEAERNLVLNALENNIENEISLLGNAQLITTYKTNDLTFEKYYNLFSFKEATYTHLQELENNKLTKSTSFYSGLFSTKQHTAENYYCFEYNPQEGNVTNLYANEVAKENETRHTLFVEYSSAGLTYSISNKILNLLNNAANPAENIISFLDTYAYINAKYSVERNNYIIESNFVHPDTNLKYELCLNIEFNQQGLLHTYNFSENVYENDELKYEYKEQCDGLLYYEKLDHDLNIGGTIDLSKYFLESFVLENCNEVTEHYDYSNTEKYGAQQVDIINGITKYTVLKHKTLVLKVKNNGSNSNASLAIDRVEGSSSNPLHVPDPILTGHDIFAINPYKDPATDEITLGEATLTFVSSLGVEQKVIVEFVDSELLEVYTTLIPENNKFEDIFKGRYSSYFHINTNPDEDKYEYYLDVVEGDPTGIELMRHSYDNIWSYPGFSYSVKGLKVGSYKFRIGVVGSFLTTADYYTINVVEPYSANYLIEELVNKNPTFIYYTGTLTTSLSFNSATQLTLTTEMLGESPVTSSINCRFEDGKITLDSTQKLTEGMYFGEVKEGEIYFNKDLSSLILLMSMEDDTSTETHYTVYEFKQKITDLESYLNGKTCTSQFFVYGLGSLTATMNFNNGVGTIMVKDESNKEILNCSFNYYYDVRATSLYLSNIVYNYRVNENYSIDDEIYFHDLYGRLELRFYINSYDYEKITFNL